MKSVSRSRARTRPARVFLSYAEADTALAGKVRDVLARHLSVSVFFHGELSAGENWQAKIRRELDRADIFVALLSPNSVGNSWVLQETGAAWALDKPIIPIVTRTHLLDRFPIQFRSVPPLDMSDLETAEGSSRFAESLEEALAMYSS